MSYYDTLSNEQKKNIDIIVDESKKAGITNPNTIAGMLAIVSKESAFKPKGETSYANTSNERIREVFGSKTGHLSDSELNRIKADPKAFFDLVYGGRHGNAQDEGYKYRGRGFNQLTFKGNYEKYGKLIGEDLVSNPDKVNNIRTAAKVLIAYNKAGIDSLKSKNKLKEYNANDINDFKNTKDATLAFYHATAGTGKDVSYVKGLAQNDHLGGMTRALSRVESLYDATKEFVKKKPLVTIMIVASVVVAVWALMKYTGTSKKIEKII